MLLASFTPIGDAYHTPVGYNFRGGFNCPRIVPMLHYDEETALPTDLHPVSVRPMHAGNLNNASYNQSLSCLNCSIPIYLHQTKVSPSSAFSYKILIIRLIAETSLGSETKEPR
jgi:hypothetical protein